MDTYAKERDELRSIQAIFEQAVTNNTIEDMRNHIAPDFSFVSFTDRSFSDFDAFVKQWKITRSDMVGSGSFSTQLEPVPALFIDDIAVCYGNSSNQMHDIKNTHYEFSSHWTVVFQRINNEWKVLRAHNSLDPFANPMLKNGVKKLLIKFVSLGVLSGALLCFFLMKLTQL